LRITEGGKENIERQNQNTTHQISETVRNKTDVHINFFLRMTDTMTSQNIDLPSWDILYICVKISLFSYYLYKREYVTAQCIFDGTARALRSTYPCAAYDSERDNCECYLEGGASDECLPTAGTGVLGPAGGLVQLLVRAPMAALCELSPAICARIGTLTRMDAPMLHQQLTPGKEFSAVLTTMALRDWSGLRRLAH
jgi:hypothetical protein